MGIVVTENERETTTMRSEIVSVTATQFASQVDEPFIAPIVHEVRAEWTTASS